VAAIIIVLADGKCQILSGKSALRKRDVELFFGRMETPEEGGE
jgi:hypothetical protein